MTKFPAIFISHGGGPWPYIPEMMREFAKTAAHLEKFHKLLPGKPKAVLSISGHWEEPEFTVSAAKEPGMIYDYRGFPEHTYHIKYPAPGSPELAGKVRDLLSSAGIPNKESATHGFDHGTFVPLALMFPEADIPVVSLSIASSYDPEAHIKMGAALEPLRKEGVLIMGSGLTYHNLRQFYSPEAGSVSRDFGHWLNEAIEEKNIKRREKKLIGWEKAPAARLAHPDEDHLLPLMVVVGAAGEDLGKLLFLDHAFGIEMASYQFG